MGKLIHGARIGARQNGKFTIEDRLYRIWAGMLCRCRNPKMKDYPYYGGRGIAVCPAWLDYAAFRDWGQTAGYVDGLTIERIDADGDYEPENCEWITRAENNRRRNIAHPVAQRSALGRFVSAA